MSAVQTLDQWAAKFVQTFSLTVLKDAVIGIDASYYLDSRLNKVTEQNEEPLKAALGGIPFAFKSTVEYDIKTAKEAGVTLVFIFNGLDFVNKSPSSSASSASLRAHEEGWRHYMNNNRDQVASAFGRANYPLDIMYTYLRRILQEQKVEFLVAPFGAIAQLSYMLKCAERPIDAIMSSTEAFLFDVEKVILDIDTEQTSFSWLSKSSCEERLGRASTELFRDAQLILGCSFLPTFPILERGTSSAGPGITDAVALLNGAGRSVLQLCGQYRDDPAVQQLEYADRYKKAVMATRHHVVLKMDGSVEPLDLENAPADVHEFVGQRLPDELFFYISRGLIGPEVPNWLTSGEINLTLPGGALDSDPYKRLVIEQLNPVRTQALKIVAETLHYYYSSRVITLNTWDGRDTSSLKIELKGVLPARSKASEWKVTEANLPTTKSEPTFLACIRALTNAEFAAKSITKGKVAHPALKSQPEIIANAYWRFLQIRGYIDDKHELTPHGIMLEAVLSVLDKSKNSEELGVLAVEMYRLGLFNTNSVTGATVSAQDAKHRSFNNLISKIACLARLRHEAEGYYGSLDRQLLSFAWMATAVRTSLRNLMESVVVSMFLSGDASRERSDWTAIPSKLPFIRDNGSSLGVVVQTYLGALKEENPSEELKNSIKNQDDKYRWFKRVKEGTLHKSLSAAFGMFDAIHAGVQIGAREPRDVKMFADAGEWLAPRR